MMGVPGRITEWARPHVPEASDGILTSAGICEGFAGADAGTKVLIFAGFCLCYDAESILYSVAIRSGQLAQHECVLWSRGMA